MARIHWLGLAVSLAVTWGLAVMFMGWAAWLFNNWCGEAVEVIASVYIGFGPTFLGGIIGLFWALLDGAIGGIVIALIYNLFVPKARTGEEA